MIAAGRFTPPEKNPVDRMIVAREEIFATDSSVREIAAIPPGRKAWRKKRGDA